VCSERGWLQSYLLYNLVIRIVELNLSFSFICSSLLDLTVSIQFLKSVFFLLHLTVQFYVDNVKETPHFHFISGSHLLILCLLVAG
jgi:hypothetical protein